MLVELRRHLLTDGVVQRQLEGDLEHGLAVEGHPRRSVRLLEVSAGRQGSAAVEDTDVVEAQEAALEHVRAGRILAVHPPGEVDEELLENRLEELEIALTAQRLLATVDEPARPRVHGRVHVAEIPLVGGNLPARMQVLVIEHQEELVLGEVGIDEVQRDRVEGQIPRRVPGIFPLVRHRDDVGVHHVGPPGVPKPRPLRGIGIDAVLLEPRAHVVEVELLAPQHAGQRLAQDQRAVRARRRRCDGRVELVGLRAARVEHGLEVARERPGRQRGEVRRRQA